MLAGWKRDFGASAVELWSISWSGTESYVAAYAQSATPDSTSACLVQDGSWSFYFAYGGPSKDDLWVVDKTGTVVLSMSLISQPVTSSTYATLLDDAVRAALAR